MRLTASALVEGWKKLTLSALATLKLCQVSDSLSLAWLMVVVLWPALPLVLILPLPDTMCPPVGAACAYGLNRNRKASVKLSAAAVKLPDCLPRPRVVSDTAIQAC